MAERHRHYDFGDPSVLNIPRLVLSEIPEDVARAHSIITGRN
jgi:hypothetical protein